MVLLVIDCNLLHANFVMAEPIFKRYIKVLELIDHRTIVGICEKIYSKKKEYAHKMRQFFPFRVYFSHGEQTLSYQSRLLDVLESKQCHKVV